MKPTFFAALAALRDWLEQNHAIVAELWVGFHKTKSGRPSVTWPEAVALCFGWIDGVRRSVDETSYAIRFTPRRLRSTWSAINVERVAELSQLGLVSPAGLHAFEARNPEKTRLYSYEQRTAGLDAGYESALRANPQAWKYFQMQAPWYQKAASWWVMSAKREETRWKRLAILIDASEHERRVPPLRPPARPDSNG